MKKFITVSVVLGLVGVVLAFGWPYIKMGFASSAYYTERDKPEYEYYTPELLKKMPRISDDYAFEFGNVSGPDASVFTVRYHGTSETRNIHRYLVSAGYSPQSQCDVGAECWRSQDSKDIVTVIKYTSPDSVVVQIYRSPYND
ncbi:hypothetical protein E1N66_15275 [Pantoea allii]|nr:hypothetical protein [Pantoea allii]THB83510.1 hypothetical protein E1N66_15275 [Pantoea allii]